MIRFSNILFIFCLISSTINTYAQNEKLRLKDMYYENSMGEKGVTYFYYSQQNKNYKAKWELLDKSRYSINYHFLNENGNLIRKYREFSDSLTSNNFYKYDTEGNLIEDYFERSDNVKGIVWYKYKNGKKYEAECRGMNGWFYGIIRYQYNENLLINATIIKGGVKVGTIEYSYDQKSNLIKEFWHFKDKWTQTLIYEYEEVQCKEAHAYTYSSPFLKETKEHLVNEEWYSWNDESKGPSYYYYKNNKLVKKNYKIDSLETVTTYEYDNDGLLMKSFRNYSDGRKAEFSYHYDNDRRLIRRLFHLSNILEGSESYFYNSSGQLEYAQWKNFDTWLTGKITFDYDSEGNLQSGLFTGDNNFDSNIYFENDDYGNLVKIKWEFSIDKTQTYWFKYDKLLL